MNRYQKSADVVFVGGGISAQLIGRYVKKIYPEKEVVILERSTSGKWSPGESTVGVAGLFLIRDLDLSTYCYLNHLPKNGLRYFFNRPGDDFDLVKCSEIGSNLFPVFPTFQLDRKKFSEDLWKLNAEMGIRVELGAEVQTCQINTGSERNYLTYEKDGQKYTVDCDWLIHSTGRSGRILPTLHAKNPVTIDSEHLISAAWGRYKNVGDLDSMGSKAWRKRVGFTARYLSTIHCMQEGFWIWIIPIGEGIVSFGVVYDRTILDIDDQKRLLTSDGFDSYIRRNPLVASLLKEAQILDFQFAEQLAYKRAKFCDEDRWAFIGESFGFIDPFYSPGSDVIARQAHLLEHLINADQSLLPKTVSLLNSYCDYEFDLIKQLYVGQYGGFGSFDLFNIKGLWDFHTYSNRMIWNFYDERYKDLEFLQREVESAPMSLKLTRSIQQGFIALKEYLTLNDIYDRNNIGHYSLRQNRFRNEEDMLINYSETRSLREHMQICQLCVSEMLNIRFDLRGLERRAVIQDNLSFAVIQNFELSTSWMLKFCDRISRSISRDIKRKFGYDIQFRVVPEDFQRNLPEDLKTLTLTNKLLTTEILESIEKAWLADTRNDVLEQLVIPQLGK